MMKTLRVPVLLVFAICFLGSGSAEATTILSGEARHITEFDQIYLDQYVEWLSSDFVQEGSLTTSSGYGYDISDGQAFDIAVGDSSVSVEDGEAGYMNRFRSTIDLATDIANDSMAAAHVSFQADNYLTITELHSHDPGVIPYFTTGLEVFDFVYGLDSPHSHGSIYTSGSITNRNITQSTSNTVPFSMELQFSLDGITILESTNLQLLPHGHDNGFTGAFPDYAFPLIIPFDIGDIAHHTVQMDFSAAIWEAQPVPEPSTLLLISTGLVGLVGFRKKFKK